MATPAAEAKLVPGQSLGHYCILEKIGAGGTGEVYRARDEHLERDVAVKVLAAGVLADAEAHRRFRQEALALSKLQHPAIAAVYDFDTQAGTDFLATEYIPGMTLEERLAAGFLPQKEALELALQMAEGLAAAHGEGLAHRDLKPGNLRITPLGRLKILDFGLALAFQPVDENSTTEDIAASAGISGTLPYMAPEQLRGEAADARSDLYAAGAVLYEMVTGQRPFQEKPAPRLIDAILHRAPDPPRSLRPELSPRLEEIVLRCLEKNPQHRYQSARDLLADLRRAAAGVRAEKSVAVLYFEDLGAEKEGAYFRDGITEDITTELSRIADLRVFSRSAVLAYRDKPVTPAYVGQQLNATHVLEGSIRREADRLRITAKLVETRTGHTLWAERYDRRLQDVFAIQDEIAQSIAAALRLALTAREKTEIQKLPTRDVQAYDFYLRGRHFFHQFRRKGLDLAREMFGRAIELDPGYARAYAGLADCSAFLHMYWDSSEKNLEQADAASRKALELDAELAEAHTSRGLTASLKKDWAEAQQEFEAAMRLDPRVFEPYYFYGRSWYAQGKLELAAQWFEQASAVLPEDYQAPMLLASALHGLGRTQAAQAAYRRGLRACEKHLDIYPDDTRALYFGANALTQIGEKERAMKWAGRALELEPEEQQVLYNVACVYALLGEAERAIDCLEKSLTRGWGQRQWMEHDPDLASLRGNERFQKLIAA